MRGQRDRRTSISNSVRLGWTDFVEIRQVWKPALPHMLVQGGDIATYVGRLSIADGFSTESWKPALPHMPVQGGDIATYVGRLSIADGFSTESGRGPPTDVPLSQRPILSTNSAASRSYTNSVASRNATNSVATIRRRNGGPLWHVTRSSSSTSVHSTHN
jgi:hypothetical protein